MQHVLDYFTLRDAVVALQQNCFVLGGLIAGVLF